MIFKDQEKKPQTPDVFNPLVTLWSAAVARINFNNFTLFDLFFFYLNSCEGG